MPKLSRLLHLQSDRHLNDEQIIALVDGESSPGRLEASRAHLEACWRCRARRDQLESTIFSLIEYRENLLAPFLPPPALGEDRLLARLAQREAQRRLSWRSRVSARLRFLKEIKMNPILASGVVVGLAVAILLFIWQRNLPTVSANELLVRADGWDASNLKNGKPGVIYQELRIGTPHKTFHRTLYRDRQGQRNVKMESQNEDLASLQTGLDRAGVNWDEPLSVASYRAWRERQNPRRDEVTRSGKSLLTLTTKTSDSVVLQESLTVREEDFHPVRRTLDLSGLGTIEIVEINYAVLDWNAVNETIFEPVPHPVLSVPAHRAAAAPHAEPFLPQGPALPTTAELDDAELHARLALNEQHADAGEQIRVTRSDLSVEIKGVVDTEDRKTALLNELNTIPLVRSSLLSIEELNANAGQFPVNSIKAYSLVGQASPLSIYLKGRNVSSDDLSRISQQLLDASLHVQHSAAAMAELVARFPIVDQLTTKQQEIRSRLLESHAALMKQGLFDEQNTLEEAGLAMRRPDEADTDPDRDDIHTTSAVPAERNLPIGDLAGEMVREANAGDSFCQELIVGNENAPRSAPVIGADLRASLLRLRDLLSHLRWSL